MCSRGSDVAEARTSIFCVGRTELVPFHTRPSGRANRTSSVLQRMRESFTVNGSSQLNLFKEVENEEWQTQVEIETVQTQMEGQTEMEDMGASGSCRARLRAGLVWASGPKVLL